MKNEMNIISVQYVSDRPDTNTCIRATINGEEMVVPISEGNRHYDEIMRQVAAGDLTIADAE